MFCYRKPRRPQSKLLLPESKTIVHSVTDINVSVRSNENFHETFTNMLAVGMNVNDNINNAAAINGYAMIMNYSCKIGD